MKMKLVDVSGELINKHSEGDRGFGRWGNPLPVVPAVGTHIIYQEFDPEEEHKGKKTKYRVVDVEYIAEESWNNTYESVVLVRTVKQGIVE